MSENKCTPEIFGGGYEEHFVSTTCERRRLSREHSVLSRNERKEGECLLAFISDFYA